MFFAGADVIAAAATVTASRRRNLPGFAEEAKGVSSRGEGPEPGFSTAAGVCSPVIRFVLVLYAGRVHPCKDFGLPPRHRPDVVAS